MALLNIRNLTVSFATSTGPFKAVDGIDVDLAHAIGRQLDLDQLVRLERDPDLGQHRLGDPGGADRDHRFAMVGEGLEVERLGALDALVPCEVAGRLTQGRTDWSAAVIPGAGHAPFLSHPEAFLAELDGFLCD